MSIEYDLMDDLIDKLIEVRRFMSNDENILAAFQLGIATHILQKQKDIYEDLLEKEEDYN